MPDARLLAQRAAIGSALLRLVQTVEGARIEVGQAVATIEAMKMEATITASAAGVVKRIAIGKTQSVDAGDLILVVEPE